MHNAGKAVRIEPKAFALRHTPTEAAQPAWQESAARITPGRTAHSTSRTNHQPDWLDANLATDLRRTPPPQLVDRIVTFSEFLPADERELIAAVYVDGKSIASIARLVNKSNKMVRDHVRRIVRRVLAPTFAFVIIEAHKWPVRRRTIATLLFIHGQPLRPTAELSGESLHTVRRTYHAIIELAENAIQSAQLPARPAQK